MQRFMLSYYVQAADVSVRFQAETIKGSSDRRDRRSDRSASFIGIISPTFQLLISTVMCAKASFGLWQGGVARIVLPERSVYMLLASFHRLDM